jgi:hypothetical protein
LCLFSLGQAAPILEDSDFSSLANRESDSTLVIRGIIHNLLHKPDPATKKQIEAVSVTAECQMYNIHLQAQQAYINTQQLLTQAKDKLVVNNKSKDPVVKEYEKRIKKLTKSTKAAGKEVKANRDALKKLGVDATQCRSLSGTNSTIHAHST